MFTYLFVIDLGLLALTLIERRLATVQALAGLAAFIFLGAWTGNYLTIGHIYTALGFYFVFALFHAAVPIALQRLHKIDVPRWTHIFPAFALLLVLIPIFRLTELSLLVWPFVLIIDVLAIGLAIATATLLPVIAVLVLTLVAVGAWLLRIPTELTGLPTALLILACFAIFFFVAVSWACRRLIAPGTRAPNLFGNITDPANLSVQLPALSATLPFLLLIMVTLQLPLANPSPVFGLGLLLVILLLGMSEIFSLDLLPAVALVSVLGLEHAWHFEHFDPARATLPLIWYLGFYALFTIFPFVFHKRFAGKTVPWATAALAGPLHFYLIYQLVRTAYPQRSSRFGAGRICAACVTWIVRAAKTHTAHEPGTERAAGAVRRRDAVFHHPDFPDRIRSTMDHSGLGAGRRSALLAFSAGAASGPASGRRRFACRGIRSSGAQSGRAQLSSARRVPDSQLVSLHLRNRDGLPVRRRAITGAAAQSGARAQCAAVTLHPRHRPRFFHSSISRSPITSARRAWPP